MWGSGELGGCHARSVVSRPHSTFGRFPAEAFGASDSGVSSIRLIDFDMVTLSSLNRHAVADLSDVGTPKVVACKRFFERVAPWVDVDVRQELWQPGREGERLLSGDVDWVIGEQVWLCAIPSQVLTMNSTL